MGDSPGSSTCLLCGVILTVTISIFIQPTGACLRSSKPAEPSTGDDFSTTTTTTTELPNYIEKYNCSKEESNKLRCANKGRCELELNTIDKSQNTYCVCTSQYTGKQCQKRYREPAPIDTTGTDGVKWANTVAIVSAAAVVGLVLVGVVCLVCRLRSRQEQNNQRLMRERSLNNQNQNGSTIANGEAHESTKTRETEELLMEEMKNNNSELPPA